MTRFFAAFRYFLVCFALVGAGCAGFGAMVLFIRVGDTVAAAKKTVVAVSIEIAAARHELDAQVTTARAQLQSIAFDTIKTLDRRLASIQIDSKAIASIQIDKARSDLTRIVDGRAGEAVGAIVQLSGKVSGEMDAAHRLTVDADATLSENRESVRGLLRDSRLFMAEGARTSIYVRQQMPEFLHNAQESNRQWTGVTTDVHSLIGHIDQKFFGKRTFGQKVLGATEFGLEVGSRSILFFK